MSESQIETVTTTKSFPVAGPYSPATIAPPSARIIHVSGQIPGRPDGSLVTGSMTEQALACVANISAILEAAGSDLSSVLRVGIFMTDLKAFKEVNAVFERSFPTRPARSTVGVASLPLGVEIEMEVTAVVK